MGASVTRKTILLLTVLAVFGALVPAAVAVGPGITINEIRGDQPSDDIDEYFELTGDPGASLADHTYVVIGDGAGGSGVIESVTSLSGLSLDGEGFFVAAEGTFTLGTADLTTTLNFENGDNVTHLLVTGFTGASGNDLDTNDDGVLDSQPWTAIVDSVALLQFVGGGDQVYSATTVGPEGTFAPGHVYDCEVDGWLIGTFEGGEDTPGAVNSCDAEPPEATPVAIHDIQGSGAASPLDGTLVEISGVVVGDFQGNSFAGNQLNAFFVQEEPADWDTEVNTSEGIFVFASGAPDVSVGDIITVTGVVDEFSGKTELTAVIEVTVDGFDASAVVATEIALPVSDLSDLEPYEGMLVTFPQDLYISEFFNYDRFGEIVLSTARQYQGTHVAAPGDPANAVTAANILARITLDDGRSSQNPDPAIHPEGDEFTLTHTFRGGDILQSVTGVMDFAFGLYRIQPVHLDGEGVGGPVVNYLNDNPRPSSPDPVGGDVKVATFNVLNFFTHIDDGVNDICGPTGNLECRGADNAGELTRQLDKLVAGIIALDADIVGVQEIENDILDSDGNRAHDAVLTLVEALNTAERGEVWAWVGEANHYNDYPVRNDFIYRVASVTPVGDPVALADDAFDETVDEDTIEPLGRPPLAQTFKSNLPKTGKQPFTVVVNHFKSKGSSCAAIGDPDLLDGQGHCNLTRVAQAHALLGFVDDLADEVSGVLVIGDLNSYAMEDPISALEDGGLANLVKMFEGPGAYSFVFDGQLGNLDTALATRSLLNRVSGLTVFHINADEPDILDYDTSFKLPAQDALYEPLPYRVSDHDPIIIGLELGGPQDK
jgi:hypothetical protein